MTNQTLPLINHKKCTICGVCVGACLEDVLAIQGSSLVFLHPENCTYCGVCEEICPEGAVRLEYMIRWA